MNHAYATIHTPVGPFSLAVDADGRVTATAFGGRTALQRRLGPAKLVRNATVTEPALAQVRAFFAGKRRDFTLPLAPAGTAFQRRVWSALTEIPHGETRTYGQIAAALGKPSAARAVGRANATNPICLLVPCHRVIGADGSLTGFAFGEAIKRRLLAHERGAAPHSRAA